MLFILAVALELFFDCVAPDVPVDQFLPLAGEVRIELAKKGWDLKGFEKLPEDTWVFWNLGPRVKGIDLKGHAKEQLVLFMWEPPTVQEELYDPEVQALFGKIFTWDDDLVDQKRFFKFYYPVLQKRMEKIPPFSEKKFCTMIARRLTSKHSNQLYAEREKVIRFFENKPGEFDLYGMYWEKKKYKNYRGAIADKLEVLKQYKYSICYENSCGIKGYITEKIFDCFAAGVIPVYWGASNVTDYIPKECFIDRRDFKSNRQLYKHLKKITEKEYEAYLRSAERFLESETARLFSREHFAKTFLKIPE